MKFNLSYVSKLKSNHELMLVSFFLTNADMKQKLKSQWGERDKLHQRFKGRSRKQTKSVSSENFGGAICLIDPDNLNKGFLAEIKSPIAMGMSYSKKMEKLFVSRNKWINVVKGGEIIQTVGNNLFNDTHSLSETLQGDLLVVSTGIDGLLVFNQSDFSRSKWDWLATENGYTLTPEGNIREIDRSKNYQLISTTTPTHTTHINSALNHEPGKILATLFHQGQIVEIDMDTKKTQVLVEGLKGPHSIRRTDSGYLVSDTINNLVRLYDSDFKLEKTFNGDYNWVIDTIQLRGGGFLVADSNNDRIVKIDEGGKELNTFKTSLENRMIYGFHRVDPKSAKNIFYGGLND